MAWQAAIVCVHDLSETKVDLVTIKYFCELTGLSNKYVSGKVHYGTNSGWSRGYHYFVRGRRVMIDYNAVVRWFQGEDYISPNWPNG